MEAILDRGLPYVSGPQWLAENVLRDKWVLAVAGTHGKTTTSSMLAWILEDARARARLPRRRHPAEFRCLGAARPTSPFFVIEADEYDTAFFDKRSKFVHYRPRTAMLNNLEYDHADIFPDLAAIETQFHHLVRTVPAQGRLVVNGSDANLERVLARGAGRRWSASARRRLDRGRPSDADDSFDVLLKGTLQGTRALAAHGRAQPHERARRPRRRPPRRRARRRPASSRSAVSRA